MSASKLDSRQHFRQSSSFDRSHSRKRPREPSLDRTESTFFIIFSLSFILLFTSVLLAFISLLINIEFSPLTHFFYRCYEVVYGHGESMPISVRFQHTHPQPLDETAIDLRDLHTPPPQQQRLCMMLLKAFHLWLCKYMRTKLLMPVRDSYRLFEDGEERALLTSITSSSPCLWPPPPEWRNYSIKRSLPQGQRHKLSFPTCLLATWIFKDLIADYFAFCILTVVGEKWTFLQNQ